MTSDDRAYYTARLAQEEASARGASCDTARMAHERLAEIYRAILAPKVAIAA